MTVYERDDRLGGLMMYGIPNMKLEKSILDFRVEIMEQEGISFFTSTDIGSDNKNSIGIEELSESNDVILLATGATQPETYPYQIEKQLASTLPWTF